ncbi:hypothetical protein [Phyllobacterium sp. P5_D12]
MTAHTPIPIDTDILTSVRAEAARHSYSPRGTVRCVGVPLFRNPLARDCACLLDFDPDVLSWSCLPLELVDKRSFHFPDFRIERSTGPALVDVFQSLDDASVGWIKERALEAGYQHEIFLGEQINSGFRLHNAKDLLRYTRTLHLRGHP